MSALLLAFALAAQAAPQAPAAGLPEDLRVQAEGIRWTPELTDRLIREMPKVETHLHLDGALSPKTIKALAVRQKYAPLASKSLAEIAALTVVDRPRDSLAEVLAAFRTVYPLLLDGGAVEQAAYEAAAAEHRVRVRYVEVRFAPALQATDSFTAEQALKAALKGLRRAKKDFGIGSGVILCLIRPFDLVSRDKNAAMVDLAAAYVGRGVVGIDLAGDEAAQPLSDFKDLYLRAKEKGLRLTAHAGEVPASRDLETALDLGVDRLGHATLLPRFPGLAAKVRERGLPIEVNLTSNLRTGAVKDLRDHPVKDWHRAGIPIALSTDDPGVFGIDLDHEYRILARELGFSPEDILDVDFQGIDALFLPAAEKAELRLRFETEVRGLLARIEKASKA